jgi:hypothetical protein
VGYTYDFPITQYPDDTLLIMEAYPLALKAILNTFADCIGLKVNYSKSSIYPININQEKFDLLAATFHYQTGTLPFTYLGLSLSVNKPTVQDCLPLVHRVEKRLTSTSIFLSQGGKLEMVNSVFSFCDVYDNIKMS